MIHPLVLHVFGASESVLVAHLFVYACGTCVSVFHIKPAQETFVLVSVYLHDVQEVGLALTLVRLKPCGDVGDDVGFTNGRILDLGRWHLSMSTAVPTLTTTTSSASSTTGRIIRLLLLETLKQRWGINLGWGMGDCSGVVGPCSTGCNFGPWDIGVGGEHRHLRHQHLLLLVELFVV